MGTENVVSEEKTTTEVVKEKVENVKDTADSALAKAKASFASLADNPLMTELLDLAKGAGLVALDAALVYVDTNVDKVDFGNFKSTIVALSHLGIRELRNFLHGGQVVSE
jgi:hypothetical protein